MVAVRKTCRERGGLGQVDQGCRRRRQGEGEDNSAVILYTSVFVLKSF